jgi:hypothetical protein
MTEEPITNHEAAPPVPESVPSPPEVEPAAPPRARRVPIWVVILLIVVLFALCCLCCALAGIGVAVAGGDLSSAAGPFRVSTPGIDTPITVEGVQLQLTSAKQQSNYQSATRRYKPTKATDIFLVIEGEVDSGNLQSISKWGAYVTDEDDRQSKPSITTFSAPKDDKPGRVVWVIVVSRSSQSFTLHLPDEQEIDLGPILESER